MRRGLVVSPRQAFWGASGVFHEGLVVLSYRGSRGAMRRWAREVCVSESAREGSESPSLEEGPSWDRRGLFCGVGASREGPHYKLRAYGGSCCSGHSEVSSF